MLPEDSLVPRADRRLRRGVPRIDGKQKREALEETAVWRKQKREALEETAVWVTVPAVCGTTAGPEARPAAATPLHDG